MIHISSHFVEGVVLLTWVVLKVRKVVQSKSTNTIKNDLEMHQQRFPLSDLCGVRLCSRVFTCSALGFCANTMSHYWACHLKGGCQCHGKRWNTSRYSCFHVSIKRTEWANVSSCSHKRGDCKHLHHNLSFAVRRMAWWWVGCHSFEVVVEVIYVQTWGCITETS